MSSSPPARRLEPRRSELLKEWLDADGVPKTEKLVVHGAVSSMLCNMRMLKDKPVLDVEVSAGGASVKALVAKEYIEGIIGMGYKEFRSRARADRKKEAALVAAERRSPAASWSQEKVQELCARLTNVYGMLDLRARDADAGSTARVLLQGVRDPETDDCRRMLAALRGRDPGYAGNLKPYSRAPFTSAAPTG